MHRAPVLDKRETYQLRCRVELRWPNTHLVELRGQTFDILITKFQNLIPQAALLGCYGNQCFTTNGKNTLDVVAPQIAAERRQLPFGAHVIQSDCPYRPLRQHRAPRLPHILQGLFWCPSYFREQLCQAEQSRPYQTGSHTEERHRESGQFSK